MSPFEKSVRLASNKVLVDTNLKCYEISWDLFSGIVSRTPSPTNPGKHAEGVLVNQWYPAQGGFSSSGGTDKSPSGSGSLARIKAMMNGVDFYNKDGRFTLSNNLPYGILAETLGWQPPKWSGVPPYRMVALSLQATLAKYKTVRI